MEQLVKCAGAAIIGAVLCLLTKRQEAQYGILVSIGTVLFIVTLGLSFMKPVMAFAESMGETAGLAGGITGPVLKALGMGILTEVSSGICEDAGEKTIASMLRLSGSVASVYVLLPLMESLMTTLQGML